MTLRSIFEVARHRAPFPTSLLLLGALAYAVAGCSKTPAPRDRTGSRASTTLTSDDYLDAARESLRRRTTSTLQEQNQATYAREVIEGLNNYLRSLKTERPFPPLAEKDRAWLKEHFRLEQGDLAEIESPVFTLKDADHLELCFQMGDVARALDLEDWPTLQRARLAFEWVVRAINLKERARHEGLARVEDDALPPRIVLQNLGFGTARERACVFLALLQQLGIDGCMIAVPDENGGMKLWLPGVLVAKDEKTLAGDKVPAGIYLFDTRLGIPLPGSENGRGARLSEVMADPSKVRAALPGDTPSWAVPELIGKAEVHLICSLAGFSPRMRQVEQKLGVAGKYVLADGVESRRQQQRRFQEAMGPASKAPVRFWTRLEGQRGAIEMSRLKETMQALVPTPTWRAKYPSRLDPVLYDLIDEPIARRHAKFIQAPRGLMIQGRFDDAIKVLLQAQAEIAAAQQEFLAATRGAPDLERATEAWCAKLKDAKLRLSARDDREDRESNIDKDQAEGHREIVELTSESSPVMRRIVSRVVTTDLAKESTYLICLAMQEKAEQLERKLDRFPAAAPHDAAGKKSLADARREARDAWANAQDRWHTFANEYGLTVQSFKKRLGEIQALTRAVSAGPADKFRAAIALALYELLALDLCRSVAATLLQSRAWEKAGQKGALKLVEQMARDLEALEKSGHLGDFKKYPTRIRIYQDGIVGYTSPDNVVWLKAALGCRIRQMKKNK